MILSDTSILEAQSRKAIVITPFDRRNLGGNSYDVHLSPYLLTYKTPTAGGPLDCREKNETQAALIEANGYTLYPGILYLASTLEYTETHEHVPYLDGKSSVGRLGINIHATAGRGDVGFCGYWTMEISVVQAVRVYAGMPIGQLTFHTVDGSVHAVYARKPSAKYANRDPWPMPSAMWRNFLDEGSTENDDAGKKR